MKVKGTTVQFTINKTKIKIAQLQDAKLNTKSSCCVKDI